MNAHILTFENWSKIQPHEKFGVILNLFSKSSLVDLFLSRLEDMGELNRTLSRGVETMIDIAIEAIVDKREHGILGDEIPTSIGSFYSLKRLGKNTKNRELSRLIAGYVDNFIEIDATDGSKEKRHDYIYDVLNKIVANIISDLDEPIEKVVAPRRNLKPGDYVASGLGFEVVMGSAGHAHVKYPDGDIAVAVMHDPRENHFLVVERYNPVSGLFMLEFPKTESSDGPRLEIMVGTVIREQAGLSARKVEKIGRLSPESTVISSHCDVFYGNFDLDDELKSSSNNIRSAKKITEEGLYQAAFDGLIECSLTLAAMSIWRAFEITRKKRVANSRRAKTEGED